MRLCGVCGSLMDETLPTRTRRHTPDHVAHVIGHQQRAFRVDGDADRASACITVGVKEASEDVLGRTRRLAVLEGNEDHFVA